jgi:anti-anti-sigma factor
MEMQFFFRNGFTEIVLSGSINMGSLITLTPQLTSHLNRYNKSHLVLNLSNTQFIDSSIIHLFINVQRRLRESRKSLYLLNPSQAVKEILVTADIHKSIPVIDTLAEIEWECKSLKYLDYTFDENGMNRLQCSCEICGSKNVIGYFLDCSSIEWGWKDDDYFPFSHQQ